MCRVHIPRHVLYMLLYMVCSIWLISYLAATCMSAFKRRISHHQLLHLALPWEIWWLWVWRFRPKPQTNTHEHSPRETHSHFEFQFVMYAKQLPKVKKENTNKRKASIHNFWSQEMHTLEGKLRKACGHQRYSTSKGNCVLKGNTQGFVFLKFLL